MVEQTVLDAVDIATAAQLLGVSTQAVHKRIRRGTLTASKRNGRWSVVLPDGLDAAATVIDEAINQPTMTRPRPSRTATGPLLAHLQDEVQFLREELTRRDEELRREREQRAEELLRKDQIIAALAQRLPALPGPSPADQPAAAPATPPPTRRARPWWALWRRDTTGTGDA